MMNDAVRRSLSGTVLALVVSTHGCETEDGRIPIDVASLGPQLGEVVPAFRLPDQNGTSWTLDDVLGPNGALLLFHRSADW